MANYSRLFGGPFDPFEEEHLVQLADRMRDVKENRRGRKRGGELVVSALVYLGQFIDHDLTRDETELDHAADPPENRINVRTPFLDLDSVYGAGPQGSPKLYDQSVPNGERFLLGDTEPVGEIPSTPNDIPLDESSMSAIADDRNEENLIIAQLHVVFLQFHNRVLDYLSKNRIPNPKQYGSTPFEQARRFVIWHYQWIVSNEFLPRMALDETLADVVKNGPKFIKPMLHDDVALPIEFTHAAFRFGHSMVQKEYRLAQERVVSLRYLVKKTGRNQPRPRLKATDVIDWYFFITKTGQLPNFADNIDTLIAEDMYKLPPASIKLFSDTQQRPLPAITLIRGSRIGLASGQQACETVGIPSLAPGEIGFDKKDEEFLSQCGMLQRTPLWYYILREAEVLGAKNEERRKQRLGGECLGPLGSRIVAEVLLGVMKADPSCYLNAGTDWKPPHLVFGESRESRQITRLRDIISFAKNDLAAPNASQFWRV